MSKKSKANTDYIDQLNAEFGASSEEGENQAGDAASKENFAAMLGESLSKPKKQFSVGDKIKGQILVLGKEDVYVSLGSGSQQDGVISRRDINEPDGSCTYKVGDTIELYVTQVRGAEIRLSRNPTDKNIADDLEDAFDMMLPVQGRIVEVCKGGVRVNVRGKIAFCPISQIDVKHVEKPEDYVGKSLEFRITQFSEGGRNIVVSRRKVLEEERELSMGSFLEENKDGALVSGKVVRLEKFGAFVELAPGVEGLVHISEIAWSRIGDPSEILQVGQTVTVKILKRETIELKEGRESKVKISLSVKQATEAPAKGEAPKAQVPDSWSKYTLGQVVSGKINRKEVFGLFVQLEPGITGLLHKSKAIDRADFQYDKLKVGDSVTVQIGEIKLAERRISLELPRDPNEDDWKLHMNNQSTLGSKGGSFGNTLADKLSAALQKKTK